MRGLSLLLGYDGLFVEKTGQKPKGRIVQTYDAVNMIAGAAVIPGTAVPLF